MREKCYVRGKQYPVSVPQFTFLCLFYHTVFTCMWNNFYTGISSLKIFKLKIVVVGSGDMWIDFLFTLLYPSVVQKIRVDSVCNLCR